MRNYTVYHLHDDTTNADGYADSCSKYTEYIKLAKEQNMSAIAFSNHGSIYEWVRKKQDCDKAGIKYIHGIEAYLCESFSDKDRGTHIGLYAKNLDGVLELNTLISNSTLKGDINNGEYGHFYGRPRVSLDELINTSNNIIITTACLQSPLNLWMVKERVKPFKKLTNFLKDNKHRCFLEVQYHSHTTQVEFNKKLYQLHLKTGIPLIAGTDTHSSNDYKAECRKILQISKDSFYGDEDSFNLTWKTYDELVEAFKVQNALPEDVYLEAIENTNVLADMVESFELDRSFKYPVLYGETAKEQWFKLIIDKFKEKEELGAIVIEKKDEYKKKIKEEFDVMTKLGMQSFMMFMSELQTWCIDNNIPFGFGRGSVAGSVIAYLTDITDVDPVVWGTTFSRFCNADRVSLADVDIDYCPEDRDKVYNYIINRFTPEKIAYIASFSTLKDRGCIDVLAKGLHYEDLDKVMEIKNKFDDYFQKYTKVIQEEVNIDDLIEEKIIEPGAVTFDYHDIYINSIIDEKKRKPLIKIKKLYDSLINDNQDLFYYLDGLKGTIIAKGNHPAGILGSPITVGDNLGVFYKDGDKDMPITTCSMKAVDSLNYVKFDILGLKTIGVINDACEYIGIPYPKSYEINWNDEKVWDNMIETSEGIFQMEGEFAHSQLKQFRPTTINHMSMVNAAIRPSGKSYRDKMISGEINENPSKEIDDLLKANNGYLIFQEDTIKFLTDICGFSGSHADTVRRVIAKGLHDELDKELPQILDGYCEHSPLPRVIAEEQARQFVQIISDSSNYQFGLNHSTAYSMNGYVCAWLRTYYPLEFAAAYLNRAKDEEQINKGIDLASFYNIKVLPIRFGKSLSKYTIDKENNLIHKGINSIKFCNSDIADELMELSKDKKYDNFVELLDDIKSKTSVNSKQLEILIGLKFFEEFGKNKYLQNVSDIYDKFAKVKQIKKAKLEELGLTDYLIKKYSSKETEKLYKEIDNQGLIKELCSRLENEEMSVPKYIKFEMEYLEYATYKNEKLDDDLYIVIEFKTYKHATKPYITLMQLKTGKKIRTKIKDGNVFKESPFGRFSILKIDGFIKENKTKYVNEKWTKIEEKEEVLYEYKIISDMIKGGV